jgi:hypothetical protein
LMFFAEHVKLDEPGMGARDEGSDRTGRVPGIPQHDRRI